MKNIFKEIKDFISRYKGEQWFKYTAIIVICIIAAIAANEWRKWEDSKELPPVEITEEIPGKSEENPGALEKIWDESKAHVLVFTGLSLALFIVQCKKSVMLEESGGKIK